MSEKLRGFILLTMSLNIPLIQLYIYFFLNENFLDSRCSPRSHRPFNKTPNTGLEKPSFKLLARVVQRLPNITSYCYCPWLLLRGGRLSPYCWRECALQTQGPGAPDLALAWKPPPWRLAIMVPENSMKASKGRKPPAVTHSNDEHDRITLTVQ